MTKPTNEDTNKDPRRRYSGVGGEVPNPSYREKMSPREAMLQIQMDKDINATVANLIANINRLRRTDTGELVLSKNGGLNLNKSITADLEKINTLLLEKNPEDFKTLLEKSDKYKSFIEACGYMKEKQIKIPSFVNEVLPPKLPLLHSDKKMNLDTKPKI